MKQAALVAACPYFMHFTHLKRLFVVFFTVVYWIPMTSLAQKNKARDFIYVAADGKGDYMRLRWAPSSAFLWQLGNRYGYTITKYLVSADGRLANGAPKQEYMSSAPVKPAAPALMKAFAERDSMITVMASLIYDSSETASNGPGDILGRSSLVTQRFAYAVLIADLDYGAAQAAALAFTDSHIKKGERYIYKVTINVPANLQQDVQYKEGAVFCVGGEQWRMPGIGKPDLEISNNYITLHWNIEHLTGFYTAYEIERSGDGIHYTPAMDLPFVQMSRGKTPTMATFTDSLYEPNTDSIYYRVRGINPFGDRSAFSQPAAQRNFIIPAYRPHIDSIQQLAGSPLLRICWNLPDSVKQKTESLHLLVANKVSGPYFPVTKVPISAKENGYTDSVHYVSSYYKLSVVYKETHRAYTSLPYLRQGEDSIAPGKPVLVKAAIDSLGKVTLRWKPNKEKDLLGYRVFRANSLNEEFTEITRHPYTDTVWQDAVTLNTLTGHVYYTLLAVDRYYNASKYSDTMMLKRPDTIAPAPAIIAHTLLKGDTILIGIVATQSTDVMAYRLQRVNILKPADTVVVAQLLPPKADSLLVADTSAAVGSTYQYVLYTIDSSNNRSVNRSGLVVFEPGFRKAVDFKSVVADRTNRNIQLQWEYLTAGVQKFIIYRNKAGGAFTTLCTIPAAQTTYTDKEININNTYGYKIKAVFNDGKHSLISTVKEVIY
jgi:fibronectin type 3 domain-containing protein